jgi:L-fuculose-phosphate aldolase
VIPRSERGIRLRMVSAARRLVEIGISPATSGNLSARVKGGYIITPSAMPYGELHPDDLVFMGEDWTHGGGQRQPSSEWRLHRDIYRTRLDANAIVHVHSPGATTLACLRRRIPAFHYEVAFAGGPDIRCSEYATFGTDALSLAAQRALDDRKACLLANHGAIALGETLEDAVLLAERVEFLASTYWQALQVGEPVLLDDAEMARVLAKFATYGKQTPLFKQVD